MAFNFNQQTYYIDPATGQPIYIDPNENAAEASRLGEIENPWTLPKNLEITEANAAQAPGASKGPKKPGMTGLPEAIGAVAGDVGALASSPYSKYSGAATGKAVGGGVGTAIGSVFGMPQLGQQLGSLAGGLIGGASDQTKRRKDYDARTKQEFGMLNEQPNINPYGSSYMKQGGAVYGSTLERGPSFLDQYMTDIKTQSAADAHEGVDMNDPVSAAFARCGMMIKGKRYAKGGEVDGPGDPKPKPIYVTDPKDPRLRMYNDSLLLHNQGNKAAKDLNKRMFSNAISNTEYLQWYDRNNDPKVEAAAARLTKANKQKPQPTGTTTPVDVYKNSGVIGQAASNLYTKPMQPVIYQPGQTEPTYADSLALYNKAKRIQKRYDSYIGSWDLPPFVAEGRMLERDNPKIKPIGYQSYQARNQMGDAQNIPFSHGSDNNHLFDTPIYKKPVGSPKPKRRTMTADLINDIEPAAPQLMGRRSPNVNVNKPIVTNYSYAYRTPEGGQKVQYFPDHATWQDFMKDKTYTSQTVSADKSRASASGYYAMGGGVGDDPVYIEPKRQRREIYTTYGQINRDNAMAKDIMRRRINPNDTTQNYLAENAFVARNIGEPVVKFAYPGGKPAQPTAPLPLTLPSGVTIDQVENTSEGYGYWHPQNGNFIKVDPAIYGKYPKMEDGGIVEDAPFMKKGGKHWIQKAVNPKHKGYCTPMTKSTCTPRRKALARTFKKHHGFHEDGGIVMKNPIQDIMFEDIPNNVNYMAEGGYANESADVTQQGQEGMQQGQKNLINVEKGELLVNPTDPNLEPERYYDNPNRYSPHQKDPMKEPIGNFTMAEEGMVVIPKKYADRFKNGDILTRKSIVGEILKNQANNPEQNEPRMGNGAEFAATGMQVGEDPGPYKYVRGVGWVPDPKVPAASANQRPFGPAGLGANWLTNQVANYNNPTVDNPNMNYGAGNTVTPPPYIDPNEDAAEASRLGELASPWKLPKSLEITEQNAVPRVTPPVTPTGTTPKRNWNLIGAKVASGIGPAFGITQALGGDPFLRYDENYGFNDALAIAEGIETNPNMEASRAALNQALATQNRVLNNIGSPSVRSEAGVNRANLLRSFGELSQNASNLSMDLRNKKRDTIGNLKVNQGANRLDMRQRLMQELRMDQANRQSLVHQGLTEAATNFQQGVMDDERIKSINTMAEFYNIDPYQASMLLDQKKFLPYVQESADAMQRQIGRNLLAKSANAKGQAGTPPFTTRNGQRFDANNNIVDGKGNIIK